MAITDPQLSKPWTVSANVRNAYTSLLDMMGWFAYENKTRMLAKNWTLKWSCDGVTGPANAGDTTDRITDKTKFQVRATIDAAAQSWFVLQNPDGCQICFCYQGASDDIMRIDYSVTGAFALAGTTTNRPTASDGVNLTAATSIINSATTLDRVMSIFCANDGTDWRVVLWRNNTLQIVLTFGKVTRLSVSTCFPVPYVAGKFTNMTRDVSALNVVNPAGQLITNNALGGSTWRGFTGRIFTSATARTCRMIGCHQPVSGYITNTNSYSSDVTACDSFINAFPASLDNLASPCWPIILCGESTAGFDGIWGTLIDWSQVITSSPTSPVSGVFVPGFDSTDVPGVSGGQTGVGDTRTNWWICVGGAAGLWPWRNAAVAMETI